MSFVLNTSFPQDILSFSSMNSSMKPINQIPMPYFFSPPKILLPAISYYSSCARSCRPMSISAVRKGNCDQEGDSYSDSNSEANTQWQPKKSRSPQNKVNNIPENLPTTKPKKPRCGRRSEAMAVEDFVRDSLEKTFASIREKNPEVYARKEQIFKNVRNKAVSDVGNEDDDSDDDNVYEDNQTEKQMVVDDDDPNWPADADVGWGIKASDYFEKHAIKNVVGDDGLDIDWEGEMDNGLVQEINCLEWETFAFHPSPLIVLVFERYNRAADNWKLLKELEKAFVVYWNAKDRLPPRAVKLDINIERDLAYALKVKQCPQILFLCGQRVLYREKELRTADELVQMIAYFYYKAKKPSWIDDAALAPKR